MIISNDEARIRAWIELQMNRSEGIIQLTSGDVKQLLKIIDELRDQIIELEEQMIELEDQLDSAGERLMGEDI